jgi:hypothetical protein
MANFAARKWPECRILKDKRTGNIMTKRKRTGNLMIKR